jgi:alpha-L-fucosidase
MPAPAWFTDARFGMFIHWGLYSVAGRGEWMMSTEGMDPAEYRRRYLPRFEADRYDPAAWARLAKRAGMGYAAITTKHHEGFSLWDTAHSDYKAPNSAAGRDLLTPWVAAFRDAGMRIGLYHSLLDWSHPKYPIDRTHPLGKRPDWRELDKTRDMAAYRATLHAQVRELLDGRFGQIDMMWLDMSLKAVLGKTALEERSKGRDAWGSEDLVRMVRQLQPGIILNDRLDLMDVPGGWDFKTPENWQPPVWFHWEGKPVTWEVCHTFAGPWGYSRDSQNWKSADDLVRLLIDTVSKGGNMILNVGPTPRGELCPRTVDRLEGIGAWMDGHAASIRSCTQAPAEWPAPPDCRYTWNPQTRRLYLHLMQWPFEHAYLPGLGGTVAFARFLHDHSELAISDRDPSGILEGRSGVNGARTILDLRLPAMRPPVAVPVVELILKD